MVKPVTKNKVSKKVESTRSSPKKITSSSSTHSTISSSLKKNIKSSTPTISDTSQNKSNISDKSKSKRKSLKPIKVAYTDLQYQTLMSRKVYKEIRKLQISTKTLIPKLPFSRLIREILLQYDTGGLRVQLAALNALQESAELYLTQFFEDAYFCTIHAKRKTLFATDMQCVRRIRGRSDIVNR